MSWNLQFQQTGKTSTLTHEQWFEALRSEGWADPLPIDDKPELFEDLIDVWNMFCELDGSRIGAGFDVPVISFDLIMAYLNEEAIYDADDRDYYRRLIQQMDKTYIAFHRRKEKDIPHDGARNRNRYLC